jgi:hypothetical protein
MALKRRSSTPRSTATEDGSVVKKFVEIGAMRVTFSPVLTALRSLRSLLFKIRGLKNIQKIFTLDRLCP